MNIVQALHDQRFFQPVFKDVRTWRSWETYLRALFGLGIDNPEDLKLFQECTGLIEPPRERARESFVVAGRRSGKSFISAVLSVYLSTFKDWSKVLSPGEVGWVFIIAVDKAQAAIIKRYIKAILEGSESFKRLVKNETQETIELNNGVNIGVKTSSFRSVRGYTILCAILEEVGFWRSEDSANPDREIVAAIKPSLLNVPDSMLLAISTPYSRSGVLYEQWKANYGQPGGPLIWKAESTKMNPTLDLAMVQRELEVDPEAARAEWLAEWREDLESYISVEMIERAVIPGRFELPRLSDINYHAFCDPSGGRADSFTLAIAHLEEESRKIILDRIEERRPPLAPQDVVKEYAAIMKEYDIHRVTGDRYAGDWVLRAFQEENIYYEGSDLDKSSIYLEFEPLIAQGRIEFLDNRCLCGQLRNLERRTRSGGRDRVDHPPGGHDDLANAAAGACVLASRTEDFRLEPSFGISYCPESLEEQLKRESIDWLLDRKPKEKEKDENEEDQEDRKKVVAVISGGWNKER